MERDNIGIATAVLEFLEDAEYHTITATTIGTAKYFRLTKKQMNEIYNSRKSNKNYAFSKKKIYTQVQLIVSKLRNNKFIKNFPGTEKKGIFAITNKGSILLLENPSERRKKLNLEFNKHKKNKKTIKN